MSAVKDYISSNPISNVEREIAIKYKIALYKRELQVLKNNGNYNTKFEILFLKELSEEEKQHPFAVALLSDKGYYDTEEFLEEFDDLLGISDECLDDLVDSVSVWFDLSSKIMEAKTQIICFVIILCYYLYTSYKASDYSMFLVDLLVGCFTVWVGVLFPLTFTFYLIGRYQFHKKMM